MTALQNYARGLTGATAPFVPPGSSSGLQLAFCRAGLLLRVNGDEEMIGTLPRPELAQFCATLANFVAGKPLPRTVLRLRRGSNELVLIDGWSRAGIAQLHLGLRANGSELAGCFIDRPTVRGLLKLALAAGIKEAAIAPRPLLTVIASWLAEQPLLALLLERSRKWRLAEAGIRR